jgi:hypothetical protein
MISKGIMDTSLERIRAKIAELETKLADLRITDDMIRRSAVTQAEIACNSVEDDHLTGDTVISRSANLAA